MSVSPAEVRDASRAFCQAVDDVLLVGRKCRYILDVQGPKKEEEE